MPGIVAKTRQAIMWLETAASMYGGQRLWAGIVIGSFGVLIGACAKVPGSITSEMTKYVAEQVGKREMRSGWS